MNEWELKLFLNQKLVEIADVLLDFYHPCQLEGNSCIGGTPNPCCWNSIYGKGRCPFWTDDHCDHPNANCKLWLCKTACANLTPEILSAFANLERFALAFGLARKPLIGQAYSGADKQKL